MDIRRVLQNLLVVAVIAACAPSYSTIYRSDRTVTVFSGGLATHQTLTRDGPRTGAGGGSKQTFNTLNASWTVDCEKATGTRNVVYGLRAQGTGIANGLYGGTVIGTYTSMATWDPHLHYCAALKAESSGWVFDRMTLSHTGDLFKIGINGTSNGHDVRLSRSWLSDSSDDCIQNDEAVDGIAIEQDLLEKCWTGISAHPGSNIDASKRVMDVDHSIIEVEDHTICYKPADFGCPNHGGWLKWEPQASWRLRIASRNTIWVAASYPKCELRFCRNEWNGVGDLKLNAPLAGLDANAHDGVNDSCHDNTFVFLSDDSVEQQHFLADVATWSACTQSRVYLGQAGRNFYAAAKLAWHQAHDAGLG